MTPNGNNTDAVAATLAWLANENCFRAKKEVSLGWTLKAYALNNPLLEHLLIIRLLLCRVAGLLSKESNFMLLCTNSMNRQLDHLFSTCYRSMLELTPIQTIGQSKWKAMRLKTAGRIITSACFGKSIHEVSKEVLNSIDIISFDIFDTLVLRKCMKPADVFDLVERRFNSLFPADSIVGFCEKRIEAERRARSASSFEEVNVYEIYAKLQDDIEEFAPILLALELEAEEMICQPNEELRLFFNNVLSMGKEVVITSDMYLPEDAIERILAKCGYKGYRALFLSSSRRKTKRGGTLFDDVLKYTNVDSLRILHIGDHPVADWENSKKAGMRSFLYRKAPLGKVFEPAILPSDVERSRKVELERSVLSRTARNELKLDDNITLKVGRCVLGPMLYGYTIWLHNLAKEEHADVIWFLAREGKVLSEAYEALLGEDGVMSRYVHVSRLSLCHAVAAYAETSKELESIFSCLYSGIETIYDLLRLFGPTPTESDLKAAGINGSASVDDDRARSIAFDYALTHFRDFFTRQRDLIVDYLGVVGSQTSTVILSDIGWGGTIQLMLQTLFERAGLTIRLVGGYFGVRDFLDHYKVLGTSRVGLDRRGYWCSANEWQTRGQLFRHSMAIAESLFLSSEGSTVKYEVKDGCAMPVLRHREEAEQNVGAIAAVHTGAINFLRECYSSDLCAWLGSVNSDSCMVPYISFFLYPTDETLRFLSLFTFEDTYADVSFISKRALFDYIKSPALLRDELEMCACKITWLKSVFRLPLPYYRMLRWVSKKTNLQTNVSRRFTSANSEIK